VIIKHMGSNPATTRLEIRLDADGTISALSSTVDAGQGSRMVLAREVARALGIPEERVRVPYVDTDATPPDQGTSSSRSTFFNAIAAEHAAEHLYSQLRELAAHVLEAPLEAVEVANGRVRASQADAGFAPRSPDGAVDLDIAEFLQFAGLPTLTGAGEFHTEIGVDPETGQGKGSHHWHQAASGAVVEVDRETGKVELVQLHVAAHAGRVIDRASAELQNEGCAAFGLSQALFEEMVFDEGQVVNPNLSDYNIASMADFPLQFTTTLGEGHGLNPEVHGLGETALPSVPPAIGNAVAAALGIRIHQIPLTPERVLDAIQEAES
jgi:CO/xanthine dehydrogenase Mo-binding subunit